MGYQEDFINKIAPYVQAWRDSFGYGVASAIIAQGCLESAYGRSNKAVNYNNYFGLKYKEGRVSCNDGYFTDTSSEQLPDGSYITITTKWFSFKDMNTGVEGYFQFINIPRYEKALAAEDPETYLQALKDAGYATSINYVKNVMAIVNKYDLTKYDGGSSMYSNSPLVCYTDLTPNNYGARTHIIDTITIHHMAGNLSVETCGSLFHRKKGSSNYGIGSDGRIALYVEEKNGAWTSSNKTNDMRAVTIEVANDTLAPNWTISYKALNSLIELCADICRRNHIQALIWSDNKKDRVNHVNGCNMTKHKDFAATACPGPYIENLEKGGVLANLINQKLGSGFYLYGFDYSPVFNPVYYADKYADLKAAFGNNATALWDHFCNYGMNELRRASEEFDPIYYMNTYLDVKVTYGKNYPMYYFHYVAYGKAEGRKGHA